MSGRTVPPAVPIEPVLHLVEKYADVPMSLADGRLGRMTEKLPDPLSLTTDSDFHIYRRNARQAIPCEIAGRY